MKVRAKIQLASIHDFCWWMEKEDLWFTHIFSLMWVRLIGETAGSLTLIVGPINAKLFIAWHAAGREGGSDHG